MNVYEGRIYGLFEVQYRVIGSNDVLVAHIACFQEEVLEAFVADIEVFEDTSITDVIVEDVIPLS
jgi:ribulose 1,5-bisphosphate synthetase/thiazole synthase